jgi:hypothetical protein
MSITTEPTPGITPTQSQIETSLEATGKTDLASSQKIVTDYLNKENEIKEAQKPIT